jgi:hypothetical protein
LTPVRLASKEEMVYLVDYLQGTCNSLSEAITTCELEGCDEDNISERLFTEYEMQLCPGCGWWEEISDFGGDPDEPVCSQCQEDPE